MNQLERMKQFGFLFAHAINSLEASEDQPKGCCPECCGPCGALEWFRDNDPKFVDEAMRALAGAGGYYWQTETGGLNWDYVQAQWDAFDKGTCCR